MDGFVNRGNVANASAGRSAMAGAATMLALTVAIWTIGEIANAPVSQAYVADLAPTHLRGRYQGAWGLTFGLALILGPVIGTASYAAGPTAFWLSCGVLGVVSALLVLGVTPRRRARVA